MSGLLGMSLDAIMAGNKKTMKPKPKTQARPQQQRPSRGGPVRAQSNRRENRATPYQRPRSSSGGGFGGGARRGADAPGKWQQGGNGNLGGGNQFGGRNQGQGQRAPQQQALSSTKVMVGNLVKDVRVGDILELFQDIGEVKSAELHYTPGGQPKGSAEVTFVNPSHAKTAIETYNKRVLDGRPMRVFLAPAATKSGVDSSDLRNRLGNKQPSSGGVNFAVTLDGSGAIYNKERRSGGSSGGMLRDEFRERRGGSSGGGDDRACFSCGKTGHIKQNCPQGGGGGRGNAAAPRPPGMGKVIGAGGKNSCFECGGMGHIAVNCPNHKYKNGGGGAGAVPRGGGGGGFKNKNTGGRGGGGGGFKKKEEPSQDDLDKEMDSYMSERK